MHATLIPYAYTHSRKIAFLFHNIALFWNQPIYDTYFGIPYSPSFEESIKNPKFNTIPEMSSEPDVDWNLYSNPKTSSSFSVKKIF